MKIIRLTLIAAALTLAAGFSACDDNKSYAELLTEENQAVNRYLADQRVIASLPADNRFETGPEAPYYRIDEDGELYMRVIRLGDQPMAVDNQLIYFRFTRYALKSYVTGEEMTGEGNSNQLETGNMSFRFGNYTLQSSSQWGEGLQEPLKLVPVGSEVELVVKSQRGWTSEIGNVQPYLYHIRYYNSKI